jgi:hypothetical protein
LASPLAIAPPASGEIEIYLMRSLRFIVFVLISLQ